MKKIMLIITACTALAACAPTIVSSNSRSVTVKNMTPHDDAGTQKAADEHCAKFGRVSVPKNHRPGRITEFECVEK